MDTVKIFDTTLRDGEQSPGISLDVTEKLEIADQLARLGVDVIEAGFPIASDGDFEAVEAISKTVKGPIITALSRTAFKDVDRAWEAVRHAEKPRIHIFLATSKIHMEKKLRMTEDQVRHEAQASVARAKGYTDDIEFSPEDAYRSDPEFMCGGVSDRRRQRCHHAEHPRHRRLRGARRLRPPDPVRDRHGQRRLHRVDALPQRSGPRGCELAGRGRERRPPGRVRDERSGGAGRQRRARRRSSWRSAPAATTSPV